MPISANSAALAYTFAWKAETAALTPVTRSRHPQRFQSQVRSVCWAPDWLVWLVWFAGGYFLNSSPTFPRDKGIANAMPFAFSETKRFRLKAWLPLEPGACVRFPAIL